MAKDYTKILLVSANVGSIFEDPEHMLKIWLEEFLSTVERLEPGLLAVHCQEVGGKNYEDSMKHVNSFVKALFSAEVMQNYDRCRFFLDEDFTAVDQFTALGNLYFIHNSVQNVQIYDFQECQFVPLLGREVLSGNIENVTIKEKAKFPQEFFPDFKWSRKGFIRTRWNIQNSIFDLVNIHLFHDANNIVAMESSPSQYSNNRERTLLYTLDRFERDKFESVPLFVFGDFNFRLDTHQLIQRLTKETRAEQTQGKKNDVSKVVYHDSTTNNVILTIEKKGFEHHKHEDVFMHKESWLRDFDKESLTFRNRLLERDVTFPPSYPFSEDTSNGTSYMRTRCPAWCDRVMYSQSATALFHDDVIDYRMMGDHVCMGDHKPIYLSWRLRHNTTGKDGHDVRATSRHSPCTTATSGVSTSTNGGGAGDEPVHLRHIRHLRKVISINGEEVCAQDLSDLNIHDYASFECQEHLGPEFMSSIKRRGDGGTRLSFKNVVKDVMRRERIMKALKHYSHRSDSEDTDDELSRAVSKASSMAELATAAAVDAGGGFGKGGAAAMKEVTSRAAGGRVDAENNVVIAHAAGDVIKTDDVIITTTNNHNNHQTPAAVAVKSSKNKQHDAITSTNQNTATPASASAEKQNGGREKKKTKKCCVVL